jgi:hypothetical protein
MIPYGILNQSTTFALLNFLVSRQMKRVAVDETGYATSELLYGQIWTPAVETVHVKQLTTSFTFDIVFVTVSSTKSST